VTAPRRVIKHSEIQLRDCCAIDAINGGVFRFPAGHPYFPFRIERSTRRTKRHSILSEEDPPPSWISVSRWRREAKMQFKERVHGTYNDLDPI